MDKDLFDRGLNELKSHVKVINWLIEGASPYVEDAAARIEQISDLAEQLAEDALSLASALREKKEIEHD